MLTDLVNRADMPALRSATAKTPIQEVLPEIRRAALKLPTSTLTKLQQEGLAGRDRLAGLLTVAVKLEMPQFPAFGASSLTQGDAMGDYDEARAFIVTVLDDATQATAPQVCRLVEWTSRSVVATTLTCG